jgi:Cys-tRNA(Pro)/Cys-tRNA(Cys) deacylase
MKTNAIRILESKGIDFTFAEYECDEAIDAVAVASAIGAAPETVFKTLAARSDRNEILVFVIPGNFELNLKKAAKASGVKSVSMLAVRELQPTTGYIRGGCSPVGMKKHFPTFIDETAQLHGRIYVSAGVRGMQVCLSPTDLAAAAEASFADLT